MTRDYEGYRNSTNAKSVKESNAKLLHRGKKNMLNLREVAKKSKTTIVAYKIYENWSMKRRFKSGNTESTHGSTHRKRALSESLAYINAQFDDYLKYSGIAPSDLKGKRILELGFGDNAGVALKFIASGASFVACLDKFFSTRDIEQQRGIYSALRETIDDASKARFDEAIDLKAGVEINPDKIRCIYGVDVGESEELANADPFDLVLSRATIQEIYEPAEAFEVMDRMLVRGGYMLHKIDLSDHGMFRDQGMNPLTFLTIPESVYRLMASGSGQANRKLITYYRDLVKQLGYEAKLLITDLVGSGGKGDLLPHKERLEFGVDYSEATLALVKEMRPRLIPAFRKLSDEELIISGVFLVARKRSLTAPVLG